MKRVISLLLITMMTITILLPSQIIANDGYDKELKEAILKAKKLFNITADYDEFDYNINSNNGDTEYYLRWSDTKSQLGEISVRINNNGKVTSYNSYKPDSSQETPKLAEISKSDALKKAKEFVKKVRPDLVDKIKYEENNRPLNINSKYYNLKFHRVENEVPYYENNLQISVNNYTGEVQRFSSNWNENISFDSKANIISIDKVKEIYKEKLGLDLVYKFKYDNDQYIPYIVYTTLEKGIIDAKTGDIIDDYGYLYRNITEEDKANMASKYGLDPKEKEAIENVKGLISKEKAEKIARDFFKLDDKTKLSYSRLYTNWRNNDDYIWRLSFEKKDNGKHTSLNVTLDAKSKDILSFNKYYPKDDNKKVKYNKEESLKIAKEFIKEMEPDKFDRVEYVKREVPEIRPLEEKEKPLAYRFNFIRKENGVYVSEDGFNITIDTTSGEIGSYSHKWYKDKLPIESDLEKVIKLDKAYDILFDEIGLELVYKSKDNDYIYRSEVTSKGKMAKLVYSVKKDKPLNIDGITGDILYSDGESYKENKIISYTDIDDSKAKSKIEVLAQYGIALPGDEFKPNQEIKQRELLYLLAKAKGYYIPEFQDDDKFDEVLYDRLISTNIITAKEKNPEKSVTKEDTIKYIIRFLGYDKVASLQGIYKLEFHDVKEIDPNLIGHIALAKGLDIINLEDGNLNPKAQITREGACILIYNYLNISS
ncbi:YcdB/YcdC domain-containing protein [Dethiothermospora halolimnae]|uniref:YcdB/YcdC domain-containing protein n=1 Tax=Dethiothermospora halolimnae TaxID=3114390 RepID=UPI003CCB746A